MPYGRGHKITIEECQRRVDAISPNIKVLEYRGNRIPSTCLCKLCGNEWMEPAKNLFRGSNCPSCFKRKNNNRTTDSFKEEMRSIRPDIEILGEYIGAKKRILCRCTTCGFEWMAVVSNLLRGSGCSVCAHASVSSSHQKSHEKFIEEMRNKNPFVEVLGQYKTAKNPIACRCMICGCQWNPTPTNLLIGLGCPDCGRRSIREKKLKSHEQFVDDVCSINPDIEVISQYSGSHSAVTLRCKICGEEWSCMASNAISHVNGCPTCNASHGEKAIASHLRNYGVSYIPQYRFKNLVGVGGTCLSYDFFIPSHNMLIEYQGEYHDGTSKLQTAEQFHKQQEHDRRKRQYAIDNGYKFIEIWYWDFKNIKSILNQALSLSANAA